MVSEPRRRASSKHPGVYRHHGKWYIDSSPTNRPEPGAAVGVPAADAARAVGRRRPFP